jgi:hypothetical protein
MGVCFVKYATHVAFPYEPAHLLLLLVTILFRKA